MTEPYSPPFVSPAWLPGGHLQTIVPALWPAPIIDRPLEPLVVHVEEGSAVRVDFVRSGGASCGTLLMIHGLGGSSRSTYILRTAIQALGRGWTVALMNLRTCGGTERLSRTLYNAGQSGDAEAVLSALERENFPRPFAAAGFSLGGNLILRYGGLAQAACRADFVAGVNAPIDLEACLRELERPANAPYEAHFVSSLCRQVRHLRSLRPVPGPPATWRTIRRLRRFDDLFTAPDGGYASSADYYAAASAAPTLGGIRVPSLLLSAANDPLVPVALFERARRAASRHVVFVHPREGGHVGYWQRRGERFWAASAMLDFFERSRAGSVRARPAIS